MSCALFTDLVGTLWGLASAMYFSVGVLRLRDDSIKAISSNFWGSGEQVAVELAQQKVDFQFGALFLFLSFLSQLITKLAPALQSVNMPMTYWWAAAASIAVAAIPAAVCLPLSIRRRALAEGKARAFNG